ncbi:hypothetical protein ACHAP3_007525 [Botrytis cinerea]
MYRRRLQFVRQFIPDKKTLTISRPLFNSKSKNASSNEAEPTKYALDNRRTILLLDFLLHLGPIAITGVLVYLNVKSVYWSDVDNGKSQNNFLNALQFGAKIHEIWIIISITAIISHFIVLSLARGSGLPFGLLGAGFQIGDFGFFFHRAFWSAMRRVYHKSSLSIIAFAIFLIMSFVLASLVGPSSAIAMRPDLDSWLMPYGPYEIHFPTNKSEIWPETLDASTLDICSKFSSATTESTCPSGGFSELKRWSSWGRHSGPQMMSGNLVNISFYEPYSNTNRQLASSALQDWSHSYTSSVSLFPYIALQGLWNTIATLNLPGHSVAQPKLSSQAATTILQPFVQVKCNIFESNGIGTGDWRPGSDITFPLISSLTGHDSAMHGDVNTITISGLDLDNFEEDNNIHMSWVNLHDFNNSASIGAVLKLPNNENSTGHNHIVPCAVDARWISTELSIEPATSQSVFGNFGSLGAFSDLGALISDADGSRSLGLASVVSEMIKIDLEWAQLMNLVTPIDHVYSSSADTSTNSTKPMPNATSIEVLLEQRLLHNEGAFNPSISTTFAAPDLVNASTPENMIQAFISIFLGILITDALARHTQANVMFLSVSSEPDTNICTQMVYIFEYTPFKLSCDSPRTSSWKFDFWRRGYSYGIKSSTTRLALAALLTHTLMALVFIVYLCFAGWTTKSWGSIGELVALALISRRTKAFRGTDAGISRAETWAQNVRIVEAGDGGLEMRFGEDGKGGGIEMGKRVQVGKKYGYQKVAVKNVKRSKTSSSMP